MSLILSYLEKCVSLVVSRAGAAAANSCCLLGDAFCCGANASNFCSYNKWLALVRPNGLSNEIKRFVSYICILVDNTVSIEFASFSLLTFAKSVFSRT